MNLEFIRLTDPGLFSLIPPELFEQAKGSNFKIDKLYEFGPLLLASPFTFFYAMTDPESHKIKGIFWAEISPLTEHLAVHALSISKDAQKNGNLKEMVEFTENLAKEQGLTKIQMLTRRPEVYEKKFGFKKSEKIIMEKSL
ncbi:hypothetical protein LCGC14_0891460 [marine sediment metagenome]|uniref:N-acetyltransferase domain-containing protein n=1 Tax=marine sediment metagenome TaxID=412755 RepID=A0A0F9PJZ3_9ZZZZ